MSIKATGKEREKRSVNEASQFLFMLVLALLVSLASETLCWHWLGLACKTACLYASVNNLASIHAVQATCKPFSQLPSYLAWFQAGFKLFGMVSKRNHYGE